MSLKKGGQKTESGSATFNARTFLEFPGFENAVEYGLGASIFRQGDPCDSILYIRRGGVKLSVLSKAGKEAVMAILGPGEFFGEGCLADQPIRTSSAKAIAPSTILTFDKATMIQLLREQRVMADRFIAHLLARNIRSEADLLDQLCNSTEKRLARTLLLLTRSRQYDEPRRVMAPISQETLAEMVGTTRSRVNFFLNKFKKLGLIEYDGELKVHSSLLSIVIQQ